MIFIIKYYNILRKQWNEYASKARDIAKHIVTGAEESRETHARRSKVIDYLDVLATSALNEKYANDGSKSSIHTYWGGNQEIATEHADGSNGIFRTNGSCESTNNPMDIEVKEYINNLGENKQYNMNKKLIRLTESDLHRIVKESVQKILKEGDNLTQETYQVNISDTVDGKSIAWVSRYSPDGYVGRLTDTVYSDGSDSTNWCVFAGTKEECDNRATEYNNKGLH